MLASPTNVKELQVFLNYYNYYGRFVHCFAGISAPLYAPLCKKVTWHCLDTEGLLFTPCALPYTTILFLLSQNLPYHFKLRVMHLKLL